MKEIEVLVRVEEDNLDMILNTLKKFSEYKSKNKVYDIYYYDPLRKNLAPNENLELKECFRIRKNGSKNFITYKVDKFDDDGNWLYSDENETELNSFDEINLIVEKLGLKKLVVVDMEKYFFENDLYKIALEFVKGLGSFLEVESKNVNAKDIVSERKKIINFMSDLNLKLSDDVGVGKPELLIKKCKE
jgi:predicted adenylyl cyclase CyaB